MRITKVYTKTGDDGTTSLAKGGRVSKDSPRIIAIGSVDETNSAIGVALSFGVVKEISEALKQIQNTLFNVGSGLAMADDDPGLVSETDIEFLETNMNVLNKSLSPLKEFILPGGSKAAAQLFHARAICRRAERDIVTLSKSEDINNLFKVYFNRLSDYLFVAARYQNLKDGEKENMWKK